MFIILSIIKERSELMDQAELAFRLQVEAHNAAEQAIQQLEEYMIEEEKLVTYLNRKTLPILLN